MDWNISDIITTDKYLEAFPQNYHKMDVFYLNNSINWRGRVCSAPNVVKQFIVSGHSDFPIVDNVVRRYPGIPWFGVNNQSIYATGLPLGITNNTFESEMHPIYGNVDVMADTVKIPRSIKNLVYMNFAVNTYPIERELVWNMFSNKSWVNKETPTNSMEGRRTFLENARNHSYVLCPRGNGIDTHRLWETLYMGSIPIVISDIAHAGWTDLPILFVKSWSELTEEYLQDQLDRFENTAWNMNKLHIGYWINHIKGTIK